MQSKIQSYALPALPAEGLVGIDLLINQPAKGDRPGRFGVFGIGRSKYYELVRQGVIPAPRKVGRKSLMDVGEARRVLSTLGLQHTACQ